MENADSIRYYAERTLARDPNFAGGHFLLGGYYSIVSVRGWREPFGRLFDSARVEARRAIELDSTFADAWMLLGTAPFYTDDDWDHARAYLSRAVRLNPTLPDANIRYGIVLAEVDRQLDSAIVHMTRAVEAEPQGLVYYNSLGDVYMRARRWDSAVSVLGRAIAIDPSAPGPRNRLIRSLEELGRYSDAIAVRRKARDPAGAEAFARAFAKDGAAGYRRALVEELRGRIASLLLEVGKPHPVWQDTIPPLIEGRIAALYARLGEWPKAMDWVLREHQRRPKRFRLFVTNPDFDGLRNDPRYLPLVRKEGLESLLPR